MSDPKHKTWCIYQDLTGCTQISSNDGGFYTELEAQDELVRKLRVQRDHYVGLLGKARRRQAMLRKRAAQAGQEV